MRARFQSTGHLRIIGRTIVQNSVQERALINLPLPVPSIPLINPLVTPLVGGQQPPPSQAPTPSPAPAPAQPPPSAPAPAPPAQAPPSSAPASAPPPSSPPTTTGPSGTGNGNGSSNGGNSNGGVNPPPTVPNPVSDPTSQPPPTSLTGSGTSAPPGSVNGTSSPTDGGSASQPSGIEQNAAAAPPTGPGLAGGQSTDNSGSGTTLIPGSYPTPTSSFGASGRPNGANPNTPSSSDPNGSGSNPTGSSAIAHHSLTTGAIAAIVILCLLFLLALGLFLVRRRSMAKRSESRNKWWFNNHSGTRLSFSSSDLAGSSSRNVRGNGAASVRSSFATNIDHGLTPRPDVPSFDFTTVTLPPMAETRGDGRLSWVSDEFRRLSTGSTGESQYLIAPPPNDTLLKPDPPTPMSVRPFSPSESFSFPKPPGQQSGEWGSVYTHPTSPGSEHHRASLISPIQPLSPTAALKMTSTFVSSPTIMVRNATPPAVSNNPFDDPGEGPPPPTFAEIEVVCRPFVPTLDDELAVVLGDAVHVVEVFDDGWAYVEKKSGSQPEKGLIPIDCLRETGQDVPAFLAAKRVSSSYGGAVALAM